MIHYRLLLIENKDTFRAEKLKRQEEFVKEFAIDYAEWCLNYNPTEIIKSKDLLNLYLSEQQKKYTSKENYLIFDSKINK